MSLVTLSLLYGNYVGNNKMTEQVYKKDVL